MELEQFSSAKGAISGVDSKLRSAHRPLAGAQVRIAIIPGTTGPRFLTGTMVFAEGKIESRPAADYRQLRLIEFWIEGQDNALGFLSRFMSGQERVESIPLQNTFMHSHAQYDASGHNSSGWPSWVLTCSADSRSGEQRVYLGQQPTVNTGLPPFRSPGDAVRCWIYREPRCDAMTNDVPFQEQFLVVVPDTRARFAAGRWSPGKLDVRVEANVPTSDLELQIIHVGSEKRSATHVLTSEPISVEVPEDAQELVVYVVHKSGDLVCLHSLNSVYRSFGKFGSPEPDSVDYAAELQSGENEVREFKPFTHPHDEKEFEFIKTVVAFSNTDGGLLFVGVNDEGRPLGMGAARQCFRKMRDPIEAQISRLKSLVTESTKPVPSVTYRAATVNGARLVVAEVKRSPSVCSTHDNRVYVRRGATSRLADPQNELPHLLSAPDTGFHW